MECERRNVNSNCNNAVDTKEFPPTSKKNCHGCKLPIEDDFSLHVSPNLEWHVACLVCCECQEFLDENCETCFIKDGRPYCRSDYVRLFGMHCSKCSESINANTLVMRAENQIFHIECFRCVKCDKKLLTGEEFGVANAKLYCKSDFECLPAETIDTAMEDLTIEASVSLHETETTTISSSSSSSSASTMSTSSTTTTTSNSIKTSDKSRRSSTDQKTPRIRTVLTEQQLQTLRSVYQTNPRPDALLKEQLCELTALSPRVIRVWFQNRRCKDKKKALHQADLARMQSVQSGGKILPMTPQTPITPEMSQVSPHGGMQAFTYPLPSYDPVSTPTLPPTPSHTSVSPSVSYPQNVVWHSESVSPFEHTMDFSSPIVS